MAIIRHDLWEKDLHLFSLFDKNLLLDVNSGSVHELDEEAYQVLKTMKEEGEEAALLRFGRGAEEVLGELKDLIKRGFLASSLPVADILPLKTDILKSLCLNVAHSCNLACIYCFASQGTFRQKREMMSFKVGKAALDYLLRQSGSRPTVEVDFFGGEPLLNWQVVEALTLYGEEAAKKKGKGISFTLTTNATLLKPNIIDFLNEHNFQVVLSLDGRKAIHDKARPSLKGEPTFERTLKGISDFIFARGHFNYYIRGTYTHYNLDFAQDIIFLADLGFKEISLEPVVAAPTADYALREEDLPILEKEYELLAKVYLERKKEGRPFNFYHFNLDLKGGPCLIKRLTACAAGNQYLAVAPDGSFYPCHQFDGQKDYILGNVFEGITKPERQEEFRAVDVLKKEPCFSCWARFYCGGGCLAQAQAFSGSIHKPDVRSCRLLKKRIECAIYVQASALNEDFSLCSPSVRQEFCGY